MSGDTWREPAQPRRGRGRPRKEGADERIIDAALVEYSEGGWGGFTIDKVAKRAGVGKSTIYLRWPDKDALLADAMRAGDATREPARVTESLRGDLREVVRSVMVSFRDPAGWAAYRVIIDAASSDQHPELPPEIRSEYVRRGQEIVARAEARGDMVLSATPWTLMAVLYGASIQHLLTMRLDRVEVTDERIADTAESIVSCLLDRSEDIA